MNDILDWRWTRAVWIRSLEDGTGEGLERWNSRILQEGFQDEQDLRAWLAQQGVTGYPQTLLVMERFGYPGFMVTPADQLIDRQYEDRPHLRGILDAIIAAAAGFGEVTIQARKTYVSLVTPRRTFARVQPTTKSRVDLGLRLDSEEPGGRLKHSTLHETMKLQISFSSIEEVDAEALGWLRKAYEENC